ncbi:hypothetical protein B296_00054468 [Ensete ventricosum]|uniref:Uncharacterized protein n=1 Tax=Ensete ventricosum TaxID=4639 RepID=A0A426XGZ3_ENSVE|nr:hypothetical protein B296_00054468 [Ensete ventricosum]
MTREPRYNPWGFSPRYMAREPRYNPWNSAMLKRGSGLIRRFGLIVLRRETGFTCGWFWLLWGILPRI